MPHSFSLAISAAKNLDQGNLEISDQFCVLLLTDTAFEAVLRALLLSSLLLLLLLLPFLATSANLKAATISI